ncbi:hypothetical protein ACWG5P_28120 [Streptomyces prasinus]
MAARKGAATTLPVRALALVGLALSIPAHRLPLTWLVRATGVLRRFPPAEPAFARRVYQAVLAVRPAWWGGRIACATSQCGVIETSRSDVMHFCWA